MLVSATIKQRRAKLGDGCFSILRHFYSTFYLGEERQISRKQQVRTNDIVTASDKIGLRK